MFHSSRTDLSKCCSSETDSPSPIGQLVKESNLASFIDLKQVEILNTLASDVTKLFFKDSKMSEKDSKDSKNFFVESETDEQLLLNIKFLNPVKLTRIRIQGIGKATPSHIQVFVNSSCCTFEDVELHKADEEIHGSSADFTHKFKSFKFQKVTGLTLFVVKNQGQGQEETSILTFLEFLGFPQEGCNMNDLKKVTTC